MRLVNILEFNKACLGRVSGQITNFHVNTERERQKTKTWFDTDPL